MGFLKKSEVKIKPVPEEVPISIQPRDRAYSDEEMRLFKSALIYGIEFTEIIKPIPGTLAYYIRNIDNDAVVEILKMSLRKRNATKDADFESVGKIVRDIIEVYKKLDEGSRKRPDVFDHICIQKDINPLDVWDIFSRQAKSHAKEMANIDIELHTPAVVTAIAKKALRDGDDNAKALFARIAGLDKPNPSIVIQDNSTHNTQVNNQNMFSNFSSSIKRNERETEANKPKQLQEGEQNYIDAEYSEVENKEKVA